MGEFKTYHPVVNLIYFVFAIGFSCIFLHPVCLAVSCVCGFIYLILLKGKKGVKNNLIYMLPMIIAMAVINPIFNHEGVTVLGFFPTGNPLTLESVLYGTSAAVMLVNVLCHFFCYNEIMTSDKFIYLFGKIIPSLSLVFSMALRFVPRFMAQLKTVSDAQRCIGRDVSKGSGIKRLRKILSVISIMITWSFENAIDTADSMKSRGYGQPGRTSFSIFTFDKRDRIALICILISGIYTLVGYLMGEFKFTYFPSVQSADISPFGISVFFSYTLLFISPLIIELWEVRRWKSIESRM